jgi:NADH dehydrogenase FAD-containing subunit
VKLLNKIGKKDGGKAFSAKDIPLGDPFVYKHLGSMASVGRYKALVDLRQSKVRSLSTVVPVKFGAFMWPLALCVSCIHNPDCTTAISLTVLSSPLRVNFTLSSTDEIFGLSLAGCKRGISCWVC